MDGHDEKLPVLDCYSDAELETLGEFLDQLEDDGAINLEELDGFLPLCIVVQCSCRPVSICQKSLATASEAGKFSRILKRGVEMRKEYWKNILDDEDNAGWFLPIFALTCENHPDPSMRPYKKPMTDHQREKLLAEISVFLKCLTILNHIEEKALRKRFKIREQRRIVVRRPRQDEMIPAIVVSGKNTRSAAAPRK